MTDYVRADLLPGWCRKPGCPVCQQVIIPGPPKGPCNGMLAVELGVNVETCR